ncbi:MAG TPA: hypothetical protein VGA79_04275 [Desulfobaccales bacterium]|jgi:hypothetical protein
MARPPDGKALRLLASIAEHTRESLANKVIPWDLGYDRLRQVLSLDLIPTLT